MVAGMEGDTCGDLDLAPREVMGKVIAGSLKGSDGVSPQMFWADPRPIDFPV